jgi:hypothetical protein
MTDYVQNHVFTGAGKRYLSFETESLISGHTQVKAVSKDQASRVAKNIIASASKTATIVSDPSWVKGLPEIGGPIDEVFIGSSPKIEKIHWKQLKD